MIEFQQKCRFFGNFPKGDPPNPQFRNIGICGNFFPLPWSLRGKYKDIDTWEKNYKNIVFEGNKGDEK